MNDEIHVTYNLLDVPRDVLAARHATLSTDERDRAQRYGNPRVRDRFIAGRGWLRCTLARCLGCEPVDICFGYGLHGKPYLLDDAGTGLNFNLAHSGGHAVCAVACGRAVGIDIEEIRADRATDALARRFFAEGECQTLAALPADQRVASFFRCWARKEAFIKAIGDGLAFPLDAFEVSLRPEEPAALLSIRGDAQVAQRWSMHELPAPPHFSAACAAEGAGRIVVG